MAPFSKRWDLRIKWPMIYKMAALLFYQSLLASKLQIVPLNRLIPIIVWITVPLNLHVLKAWFLSTVLLGGDRIFKRWSLVWGLLVIESMILKPLKCQHIPCPLFCVPPMRWTVLAPWYATLPQTQKQWADQSQTETSKTVSRKILSFL
jgi:hypothetical protein